MAEWSTERNEGRGKKGRKGRVKKEKKKKVQEDERRKEMSEGCGRGEMK